MRRGSAQDRGHGAAALAVLVVLALAALAGGPSAGLAQSSDPAPEIGDDDGRSPPPGCEQEREAPTLRGRTTRRSLSRGRVLVAIRSRLPCRVRVRASVSTGRRLNRSEAVVVGLPAGRWRLVVLRFSSRQAAGFRAALAGGKILVVRYRYRTLE